MQTTRTPYSISFMATVLLLLLFACHSTVANAAVALGATRVIYPANQKQVLLPVTNNDPASVYLIPVSYTHLTLPTTIGWCRSRWSPYH